MCHDIYLKKYPENTEASNNYHTYKLFVISKSHRNAPSKAGRKQLIESTLNLQSPLRKHLRQTTTYLFESKPHFLPNVNATEIRMWFRIEGEKVRQMEKIEFLPLLIRTNVTIHFGHLHKRLIKNN